MLPVLSFEDRTVIANLPEDQTVVEGTESVVIVCNASTDPAERKKLAVEWSKDGTIIVPGRGGGGSGAGRYDAKMTVADQGQQLTVRDVRVADTGQYTCRATNGLDVDSRSIRLTVKGESVGTSRKLRRSRRIRELSTSRILKRVVEYCELTTVMPCYCGPNRENN